MTSRTIDYDLDLLRPLEQYRQAVKVAREVADAAAS